jgi:hypothetical protein
MARQSPLGNPKVKQTCLLRLEEASRLHRTEAAMLWRRRGGRSRPGTPPAAFAKSTHFVAFPLHLQGICRH